MNPGKLDKRITFYEVVNEKDDYGDITPVQEEVGKVWAQVKTQDMKEVEATIGTELEDTVTFVVRYQLPFSIDTTMQIKYKNEYYEIKQMMPDEDFKRDRKIIAKKVS